MDVGFYYMANAMGRLLGTLLSGAIYQIAGLAACLATSAVLLIFAMYFTRRLPDQGRY
jgi:predicted MFS family arabinose efflux permease